jgi:signal transduction histidine kinase
MKYVDAMNGKVWCLSEKGKGSTIVVEFENY